MCSLAYIIMLVADDLASGRQVISNHQAVCTINFESLETCLMTHILPIYRNECSQIFYLKGPQVLYMLMPPDQYTSPHRRPVMLKRFSWQYFLMVWFIPYILVENGVDRCWFLPGWKDQTWLPGQLVIAQGQQKYQAMCYINCDWKGHWLWF